MKFQFHNQQRSRWPYRRFKNLASTFVEKATVCWKNNDIEKCLTYLSWASRLESSDLNILWELGNYCSFVRKDLAVEVFTRIIEASSNRDDLAVAKRSRAHSYSALRETMKSLEDWDWLISNKYGDESIYFARANARCELGDRDGAIEDYTEAYRVSPESSYLWQRSLPYYQIGRYEDVIKDFTEIIEMFKRDLAFAHMWRGRAYYKLGKHKEALDDFNEDMRLSRGPSFSDATVYMRTFYPEDVNE